MSGPHFDSFLSHTKVKKSVHIPISHRIINLSRRNPSGMRQVTTSSNINFPRDSTTSEVSPRRSHTRNHLPLFLKRIKPHDISSDNRLLMRKRRHRRSIATSNHKQTIRNANTGKARVMPAVLNSSGSRQGMPSISFGVVSNPLVLGLFGENEQPRARSSVSGFEAWVVWAAE